MRQPTISVILPTYNRAHVLERAIRSVLSQTYRELELLVVDDGSTDGTGELLQTYIAADARVRVARQENAGAAAARNLGVAIATGDLVAFQDSDDEWEAQFLASLAPLVITSKPATIAFCTHIRVGTDGHHTRVPAAPPRNIRRELLRRNFISTQTIVMARSTAQRFPFDESLPRFQDWDVWLSVLGGGDVEFVHLDRAMATLYRSEDSISSGQESVRDAALRMIMRKHANLLRRRPEALVRLAFRAYGRPLVRALRRKG